MTPNRRLVLPALLALCAAVVLSGCTKTMDPDKVERSAKSFLKGKLGDEKFDTVNCPDGKEAKGGVNFECTFEGSDGTTGTLNVEVTDNDGDSTLTVKSVKYTDNYVEGAIASDFKTTYPDQASALKSVECPDDIPTDAGDTVKCTLTDTDGKDAELTVTVTKEHNLDWDFTEITG